MLIPSPVRIVGIKTVESASFIHRAMEDGLPAGVRNPEPVLIKVGYIVATVIKGQHRYQIDFGYRGVESINKGKLMAGRNGNLDGTNANSVDTQATNAQDWMGCNRLECFEVRQYWGQISVSPSIKEKGEVKLNIGGGTCGR